MKLSPEQINAIGQAVCSHHLCDLAETYEETMQLIEDCDASIWEPLEHWDNKLLLDQITGIVYSVQRALESGE